ncbi:hypothetical protein B296_00012187 [Ensete ventricosum]|uniref:Uncharacterized protein n=1 Tax=Ensete ventricosum TaxID=4639 RepID=A0A427AA28_ENSVE|nr:hypothetical protein B296_00012187 [Ensete ventricosum]
MLYDNNWSGSEDVGLLRCGPFVVPRADVGSSTGPGSTNRGLKRFERHQLLLMMRQRATVLPSKVSRLGREIVYPCTPDPDEEDEGGQVSSSLAISTRWISAAKLLQYDLATLVHREGGE